MTPWRSALLGGLANSFAFAVWLGAGLQAGPLPLPLAPAHQALLWSQAIALALLLPALVRGNGGRALLLAPVLAVAVPWPLLTIFSLAGGIPIETLIAGQLALVGWALVLGGSWRLLSRLFDGPSIALSLLQAAAIAAPLFGFGHAMALVQ